MQVSEERISEIVRLLRNFARYDEAQMKEVNIHEGIDSTLMILQSRLSQITGYPAIKVIKEYGDLPLVECYAGQLNQVFMNILTNAIDAIAARCATQASPEKRVKHPEAEEEFVPCIQICTGMLELRSQEDGHPASSLNPRLFIRISDNGCGMGESVQSRIFDPFFTTKPIGTGTGLGLTTSYQIVVEHHKGRLDVTSLEGQGSEFAIELPLRQNQGKRGEKA